MMHCLRAGSRGNIDNDARARASEAHCEPRRGSDGSGGSEKCVSFRRRHSRVLGAIGAEGGSRNRFNDELVLFSRSRAELPLDIF